MTQTSVPIVDEGVDAPLQPAACTIQGDLALLAAGLDTRFLRVGTTLATAIGMIDRVIGGLDGIAGALDERTAGAAVRDLQDVAAQLTDLPSMQVARAERMGDVAQIARMLGTHVLDMHETLRVLGIYGMNIKIAAAGEAQFVGFVEGMSARLGVGEQELGGFMMRLKALTAGVGDVQQADRLLGAECAAVVPQVPRKLASDAVELAAYLVTVAELARKVATIARDVQGKVAVVLGALQVGDSARQRLEHVVSALQMLYSDSHVAGREAAVAGHVERLLVAQIEATIEEFTTETAALLGSLAQLGPDTRKLQQLIAEQADGNGRAFLARLEQGITEVERVTGRLRDTERRSQGMAVVITDTVADLTGRLTSVQRIRRDVQDMATNTRLLCRRHGAVGNAVSVIAKEIDAYAQKLGSATGGVAKAIKDLCSIDASPEKGDMLDERDMGDEREMGETLAAALGVIRAACQKTEQVVMESGDDASHLVELIERTADALREELAVRDVLEAAAQALARRTPPTDMNDAAQAALRALLPEIGRLYTMAQEREVHARFLLPGMAAMVQPVVVAGNDDDDDDDDGLF